MWRQLSTLIGDRIQPQCQWMHEKTYHAEFYSDAAIFNRLNPFSQVCVFNKKWNQAQNGQESAVFNPLNQVYGFN